MAGDCRLLHLINDRCAVYSATVKGAREGVEQKGKLSINKQEGSVMV